MDNCNTVSTPATVDTLGSDKNRVHFSEEWEYGSIIGMLLYLAGNSRPDIAFAVNQCARFTHCPRASHAAAIKRAIHYLKGTRDRGIWMKPNGNYQLNCYADADFVGLWGKEEDQDPICVKSRYGYLIMFMNCPILWSSKLQTQVALSTMEAKYISLSHAMRELIGTREILKEIFRHVLTNVTIDDLSTSTSSTCFEIPQSMVHKDNNACLQFATMPKMSPRTKHIALPYHFEKFVRDCKRLMGWDDNDIIK
jgi:hypothetical protein